MPIGDPSRTEPEQNIVFTSSPVLQPEDSVSWTGGFVWTPRFIPGLTLTVDLWDIERIGQFLFSTTQGILQREQFGGLLPGEIVQRDATGYITQIFLPVINSGSTRANGVDFGLQYVYATSFGTFTSLTQASYLNSYKYKQTSMSRTVQLVGNSTGGIDGSSNDAFLRWRGIQRLDWAWKGWDVIGTLRYTDGFHELKPFGNNHWVKQTWVIDGQASYDFTFVPPVENQPVAGYSKDATDMERGKDGKMVASALAQTANYGLPVWQRVLNGTTITIGCDNIFGQDPPAAYGSGSNSTKYPGFLYDATGRFVYISLTKKF